MPQGQPGNCVSVTQSRHWANIRQRSVYRETAHKIYSGVCTALHSIHMYSSLAKPSELSKVNHAEKA